MSCKPGEPCEEGRNRRIALGALGLMGAIFIVLSAVSFIDARGQVTPSRVSFAGHDAVSGKRVLQAYNCMGCHTVVGNGGYFGPDLTKLYGQVGPAWIKAFLPSAGQWPTLALVRLQLQDKAVAEAAGTSDITAYLAKYPGAAERISRRGGQRTLMPNLPFRPVEVDELTAFLRYTSEMNTEGWPPKPAVNGLDFPEARPVPVAARVPAPVAIAAAAVAPPAPAPKAAVAAPPAAAPAPKPAVAPPPAAPAKASAPAGDAARGKALAAENGCTACHAPTRQKLVGPGWQGLYGHQVKLADGSTVTADDAYLERSITRPDAQIVAGFAPGLMPSFAEMLKPAQIADIVAYIKTLRGSAP